MSYMEVELPFLSQVDIKVKKEKSIFVLDNKKFRIVTDENDYQKLDNDVCIPKELFLNLFKETIYDIFYNLREVEYENKYEIRKEIVVEKAFLVSYPDLINDREKYKNEFISRSKQMKFVVENLWSYFKKDGAIFSSNKEIEKYEIIQDYSEYAEKRTQRILDCFYLKNNDILFSEQKMANFNKNNIFEVLDTLSDFNRQNQFRVFKMKHKDNSEYMILLKEMIKEINNEYCACDILTKETKNIGDYLNYKNLGLIVNYAKNWRRGRPNLDNKEFLLYYSLVTNSLISEKFSKIFDKYKNVLNEIFDDVTIFGLEGINKKELNRNSFFQ